MKLRHWWTRKVPVPVEDEINGYRPRWVTRLPEEVTSFALIGRVFLRLSLMERLVTFVWVVILFTIWDEVKMRFPSKMVGSKAQGRLHRFGKAAAAVCIGLAEGFLWHRLMLDETLWSVSGLVAIGSGALYPLIALRDAARHSDAPGGRGAVRPEVEGTQVDPPEELKAAG